MTLNRQVRIKRNIHLHNHILYYHSHIKWWKFYKNWKSVNDNYKIRFATQVDILALIAVYIQAKINAETIKDIVFDFTMSKIKPSYDNQGSW